MSTFSLQLQNELVRPAGHTGRLRMDLPQLALVPHPEPQAGTVAIFYRVMSSSAQRWDLRAQYVKVTGAGSWSAPLEIAPGAATVGHPQAAAVAVTNGGVVVAWQTDTRATPRSYPEEEDPESRSDIMLATVDTTAWPGPVRDGGSATELRAPGKHRVRAPHAITHLGQTYQLARGDLHAHSDISPDAQGSHLRPRQLHRHMRDVVGLDFWALTDHAKWLNSYEWRYTRKVRHLYDGVRGLNWMLG